MATRSQVASDTWDSSIDGNWDNGPGDFGSFVWVTGGHVEATDDAVQSAMRYSGAAFADDQYAVVTVQAGTGSPGIVGAMVRMQGGTDESSYVGRIRCNTGQKYVIREWDSSFGATDLATSGTPPASLTAGWTVALEVIGTDLELFTDEGSGEASRLTVSDASVTSGEAGVFLFNAAGATAIATSWVGGDMVADEELTAAPAGSALVTASVATIYALAAAVSGSAATSAGIASTQSLTATAAGVATVTATISLAESPEVFELSANVGAGATAAVSMAVRYELEATAQGQCTVAVTLEGVFAAPLTIGGSALDIVEGGWTMRKEPLAPDRRGYAGTLRSAVTTNRATHVRTWTFRTAKMDRSDALTWVTTLTSGSVSAAGTLLDSGGVTCHPRNVRLIEDQTLAYASLEFDLAESAP